MTKYQETLKAIFGDPAVIGDPFSNLGAYHPTQAQIVQYWLWLTHCEREERAGGDPIKVKKIRLEDKVKIGFKATVGEKLKSHFKANFPTKSVLSDQNVMNLVRDLCDRVAKYERNCKPNDEAWVNAQKNQFQGLVDLEHKATNVENDVKMVRFVKLLFTVTVIFSDFDIIF